MIRWYCFDCMKYMRLFRLLSPSEAGKPWEHCANTGCKTGEPPVSAYEVPADWPADLRNPLIEATHDRIAVGGYKPSLWRKVLRWFGAAG